MSSTQGRRSYALPASVIHALEDSQFKLVLEGGVETPHAWSHRLAPTMLLSMSLSPRTGTMVLWKAANVPAHLTDVLSHRIRSATVEEFCNEVASLGSVIAARYSDGPRVADDANLTN